MTIPKVWWDHWWNEDWSWKGLANKFWQGWYVEDNSNLVRVDENYFPNFSTDPNSPYVPNNWLEKLPSGSRPATLQDYWRGEQQHLVKSPVDGSLFTRIHLPLVWQDGKKTEKADWREDALDQIIMRELTRSYEWWKESGPNQKQDRRAQFQGAIFKRVYLTSCAKPLRELGGRVLLSANFSDAAFTGKTWLFNSAFPYVADFRRAVFESDALFDNALFGRGANFGGAIFCNGASFANSAFLESANFSEATFGDFTYFGYKASFNKAAFSADADFREAIFMDVADFGGEGRNLNATVEEVADLANRERINTLGVAVEKLEALRCISPIARRSVGRFYACDALFIGPADFSNRDITDGPMANLNFFDGAKFFDLMKFHDAKLHKGVNLSGAEFEGALKNDSALFTSQLNFRLSECIEDVLVKIAERWLGRRPQCYSNSQTDYLEVKNKQLEWDREYDAWKTKFRSARSSRGKFEHEDSNFQAIYFRDLEDCFRTLKQFNEERRDRLEEARFFRLELLARSKRDIPGRPIGDRFFTFLYNRLSDFGTSISRPFLIAIFLVAPIFAGLYLAMGGGDWVDAIGFSYGRLFPFGPWLEQDQCSAIGQMMGLSPDVDDQCARVMEYRYGTPIVLGAAATLESLIAIALFFLSGLALRRRFQID